MSTRGFVAAVVLSSIAISAASTVGQQRSADRSVSTAVPVISVETSVPAEIDIGSTATFVISVKNAGKTPAEGVSIQTTLPPTVKFLQASPAPNLTGDRLIQFEIGDLPTGAVRRFSLQLVPQKPGPVDLQTKAFFSTSTQSALQVRKSEVTIACHGPDTAYLGEVVTFRVVVQNIGDGAARDVVLTPELPESSYVEAQQPRPQSIALLQAGEAKEFRFTARAAEGQWLEGNFVAATRDNREVECGRRVRILRPDLQVDLDGTKVSFLQKEADYTIRVWNPGDMTLRAVKVILSAPEGLQVTTLSRSANIDQQRRMFTWCLPELAPGQSDTLMLKAQTTSVGAHVQSVGAMADPQLVAQDDHRTLVITRPDVEVAVVNSKEAIEVGKSEQFSVLLANRGSKAAEKVAVEVLLPAAMEAIPSSEYDVVGQQLMFSPLRLAAGEQKVLKFRATGADAGDHAVRAVVTTAYGTLPTIAETTVYFYDDVELERVARDMDQGVQLR